MLINGFRGIVPPAPRAEGDSAVLECDGMGGWRKVLPGVPVRVALMQLGLSSSGTDLPRIEAPDPDHLGPHWVDRWGYLHRNPASSPAAP